MHLLKTIILLVSFAALQPLKGQKINWGPDVEAGRNGTLSEVIGSDNESYYMLISDKGTQVARFDKNLRKVNAAELKIKDMDKALNFEGIIYFSDQLLLLTSKKDRDLNKNLLFIQTIDKKSLAIQNNRKTIGEIDYERRGNSGSFSYEISREENMLLIHYFLPHEKDAPQRLGFHVMDKSLNTVWKKEVALPYKDYLFTTEYFKVDKNGTAYVSGIEYSGSEGKRIFSRKRDSKGYKYHILAYNGKSDHPVDYDIAFEDKFITDLQYTVADNGDIICGGFFSMKGTFSIKGAFYVSMDAKTKTVSRKNFKEFEEDFITHGWSDREKEKAKKKEEKKGEAIEMYEYDLDDIVLRSDGGALLVAEQYYYKVVTYTTTNSKGQTMTRNTYYYYYNDILVTNINPDGNIQWVKKIEKKNVSTNDGGFYSSYAKAVSGDRIYFIFNDNIKNIINTAPGEKGKKTIHNYSYKEGVLALVELDLNGEMKKEILFKMPELKIIPRPKVCKQTNDREMLVFGKYKKLQKFGRLEL